MKKRSTALVLCILFGLFGIHKFYLGRVWMGVLYLFTKGLFSIGWIVDIFRLALMSEDIFNEKYNRE